MEANGNAIMLREHLQEIATLRQCLADQAVLHGAALAGCDRLAKVTRRLVELLEAADLGPVDPVLIVEAIGRARAELKRLEEPTRLPRMPAEPEPARSPLRNAQCFADIEE